MGHLDGAEDMGRDPHPAFGRVRGQGITLAYAAATELTHRELHVEARLEGNVIGRARFIDEDVLSAVYCEEVLVEAAFRRRGIAPPP
jgi:hypothetical protein